MKRLGFETKALVVLCLASSLLLVTEPGDSIEGLGAGFSLAFVAATLSIWATRRTLSTPLRPFVFFYGLFMIWAVGSTFWSAPNEFAAQNLVVFAALASGVLCFNSRSLPSARGFDIAVAVAALLGCAAFFASVSLAGSVASSVFLLRPFALLALILASWLSARARLESHRGCRLLCWLAAVCCFAAIVSTASRTTTALCLTVLIVPLCVDSNRRLRFGRLAALAVGAAAILVLLLASVEEFSDRPGMNVITIGDHAINVSGRGFLWRTTLDSWRATWLTMSFGQGVGSVGEEVRALRPGPHPHNEYLRLLHDLGLFGLALWLLALGGLYGPALRALTSRRRGAASPLANAWLPVVNVLTAFLGACLLLNPLVYIFVVGPVSMMLGVAFSGARAPS